jgi:hypothetical protein
MRILLGNVHTVSVDGVWDDCAMKEGQIDCEYRTKENSCNAVLNNEEAKLARQVSCENDVETTCCYFCTLQNKCEISCNYLGQRESTISNKKETAKIPDKNSATEVVRCQTCNVKMRPARTSLRIGGYKGVWRLLPVIGDSIGELGEIQEELLPVTIYLCPKCGRMEFIAEKKAKQELFDLFNQSLL